MLPGEGETGHQGGRAGATLGAPLTRAGMITHCQGVSGGRNADLRAVPAHNYPLPFLHF